MIGNILESSWEIKADHVILNQCCDTPKCTGREREREDMMNNKLTHVNHRWLLDNLYCNLKLARMGKRQSYHM